jgi:TetR/AcrR family transcriptional regulator, transcriptional repressor for nem operon
MFKIIFCAPLWVDTQSGLSFRRRAAQEKHMPYSPEHKRDTRQKILESARRLFNKRGFADVSIGEIMDGAGLTHGGFYRHFSDKDELYAEAVRWFLCPEAPKPWQRKPTTAAAKRKPRGRRVVDAYFSYDHFSDRETCCPLIALPSDVARGGEGVKAAYRDVLLKLVEIFKADLDEPRTRERALAIVALCVGGIVVARSVDDPALADDLRNAAHRHALNTGGWRNSRDTHDR